MNEEIKNIEQQVLHLIRSGKIDHSIEMIDKSLELNPDHTELHTYRKRALLMKGAELAHQEQWDEAEALFSKGSMFYPGCDDFHGNLGRIYLIRGENIKAIEPLQKAVLLAPDKPDHKALLIKAYRGIKSNQFNENTRQAIILCLQDSNQKHIFLTNIWISFLPLIPSLKNLVAAFSCSDYETFCSLMLTDNLHRELNDDFLLWGLRRYFIKGAYLERALTWIRRWFLDGMNNELLINGSLDFLSVLACYNYFNGYAFIQTHLENEKIKELKDRIVKPEWIALLACYQPLEKEDAEKYLQFAEETDNEDFRKLIRIQIEEPALEDRIKAAIPTVSDITDNVSKAVRKQYEENPYPRWETIGTEITPEYIRNFSRNKEILIAGCGTGQEAAEISLIYPYANITAVDLSHSSLAYAVRQSSKLGLKNIDFAQCDILQIDRLSKKFDYVLSSGVLHHMKEPVAGWQKLIGVLKPGGVMKVALYSTIARRFVKETRNLIANEGFKPTLQGIREFRRFIIELDDDNQIKNKLLRINDFYFLSHCRDLVFHEQEHTFTLLEIKEITEALNLTLLKIKTQNPHENRQQYRSMFPEDPESLNLTCWHRFEESKPDLFIGMYNLFVCRAEDKNKVDPSWVKNL